MSDPRRCILSVHAHPDDEASKGAPTIAKAHADGVHTVLVCCTGGEEGDLQNPALREPGQAFHGLSDDEVKQRLAVVRPTELARATEIIGYDEVVMLGYRDSGMAETPPNEHPESFHMAPLEQAALRLVEVIRRTRPQIILTYGDDQSGYPHPDHLKVHDISVAAFEHAGDPDWHPEAGPAFQPSKMYYTVWSRARMLAIHDAFLTLRGTSPFDDDWLARRGQDERVTTKLNVAQFLWARTESLRAHATQVDPAEAFWFGLADDELANAYPYEDWALGRSRVGLVPEGEQEADLWERIPLEAASDDQRRVHS